jgi:hypothetical protein
MLFLAKSKCLKGVSAANIVAAGGAAPNPAVKHSPTNSGSAGAGGAGASAGSGGDESSGSGGTTDVAAAGGGVGGGGGLLPTFELKAIKKMKPAEMKVLLKKHGLSIQGNKTDLLARVTASFCDTHNAN